MKKSLMIIAAAILGITGITATAQTPQCCQDKGKCAEQTACTAGEMNKMRQPREFTEFAFEGILLDINQQTRIDSLNAAVKANRPERGPKCDKAACDKQDCKKGCDKKDCKNCDKKDCKKDCKNCDKKDCRKQDCKKDCKRSEASGHGHHGMRPMGPTPYGPEYVAKVKEILTPEQFVIFTENIQKMGPCPAKGCTMKQAKGDDLKKGKADKGQRKPKKAAKKQK